MKIKLVAAFLIWCCGFGNTVFAQKENYIWYFGDHAGLDFNSGAPVALINSVMNTEEGCSTISDPNGNLLFYTDGLKVWDRNHNMMPNGFGLSGGYSATQSALIVQFPGSSTMFYIFTVQAFSPGLFNYSIVDMTLNSGNGDVTVKNFLLKSNVTEKLCGVRHSNNTDVWVMVHGFPSDTLFAYLVTAGGVSTTPVVNKIGALASTGLDYRGYMKFSSDGSKLAFAVFQSNYVELFDFDASTGILSNEIYLSLPGIYAQGVEFSLSGKYLYTAQQTPSDIYQWDISSNNAVTINSTLIQIGNSTIQVLGALQMGPDGKIYLAQYNTNFLGVINYPDSMGISCNYIDNAVSLSGQISMLGLPNFIASYFLPTGISNPQPPTSHFQISPNPASDKIYISFPATASENITIKIFSITGEIVFAEENKSKAPVSNFQLPVSNFQNGIYFLSVQMEKEVVTRKIVVNH